MYVCMCRDGIPPTRTHSVTCCAKVYARRYGHRVRSSEEMAGFCSNFFYELKELAPNWQTGLLSSWISPPRRWYASAAIANAAGRSISPAACVDLAGPVELDDAGAA